jgi:hypothetical protein
MRLVILNTGGIVVGVGSFSWICAAVAAFIRKGAHGLEAVVDGPGKFSDGLIIAIRGGKEHDKEGEQESHEIRIGDQPPIVTGGFRSLPLPPRSHREATFCGPCFFAET